MGYKISEMISFRVISAPLKVNDQLVEKSCVVAPERRKVLLTPKFFLSRQKGPFCFDCIGEKIIVVRFFLDFL